MFPDYKSIFALNCSLIEKAALGALAILIDDGDRITQQAIADKAHINLRTAKKALKSLKDAGLVKIESAGIARNCRYALSDSLLCSQDSTSKNMRSIDQPARLAMVNDMHHATSPMVNNMHHADQRTEESAIAKVNGRPASLPARELKQQSRAGKYSDATYEYVANSWNDAAARFKLQKVRKLSDDKRKDFDKAILVAIGMIEDGECGDEPMTTNEAGKITPEIAWGSVITAIASSHFLQGRTDRGWKPNLSWFLDSAERHKRMRSTLEGKYNGQSRAEQTGDELIAKLMQERCASNADFGDVQEQPQEEDQFTYDC